MLVCDNNTSLILTFNSHSSSQSFEICQKSIILTLFFKKLNKKMQMQVSSELVLCETEPCSYLSCRLWPLTSLGNNHHLRATSLCPCCQWRSSCTSAAECSLCWSAPKRLFLKTLFVGSLLSRTSSGSCKCSRSFVPGCAVLCPKSSERFTNLWFLTLPVLS